MRPRAVSIVVIVVTMVLMGAGIAGATPDWPPVLPASVDVTVASGMSYQGRLTGPGGSPLDGAYTMRFVIYDAEDAGSAVWDSGSVAVTVEKGLFQVPLGVDHAVFDGRALWLSLTIDGETLSPRQEILPAPYALSLRPGAAIVGDSLAGGEAALAGYAPATGMALHGNSTGGAGVYGDSQASYGVWGSSTNSWGGYFTSDSGYGIRVDTDGTDHYDHGAYVTSTGGYGVYAQSAQNQAVRGEAGNVAGIAQPLGAVGVVGIGSNRGTYGSSLAGIGVYGASGSNYGLWAQSSSYYGATGRTSRADNNYGLYTPDNLYSLNVNLAGAVMQVMQNGGTEPLSPGDVVAFSGVSPVVAAVGAPVVQVRAVDQANSTAVAGVVFSRFNIEAIDPDSQSPDDAAQERMASIEVTPPGSASPGEFVLVVVQGLAEVKVADVEGGAIQPGDLLSTSGTAGLAGKAATMTMSGVETTLPGTVFAKALEPVDADRATIYVYVTLQ